ncbi:FAD-dependent oxidoreductase [Mycolicibacterium sp. CBM1]
MAHPATQAWDHEIDVVVLGTGAAGMTAALTAAVNGATVAVYEKAQTIGGTTAVSGGIVWTPAHHRSPDVDLPVEDAMAYLRAQALGAMDEELVSTFVRTGESVIDFVEANSDARFEIAPGYMDYKPELPGGKTVGGRSLSPMPYEVSRVGEWAQKITAFPADWSNVGFDAETRARLNADVDDRGGEVVVAGAALIAGLLKGLLDRGVVPVTGARALELITDAGSVIGVRIALGDKEIAVRARKGVILGTGGFEWDESLAGAFLRGPMRGAVSPPNNTGDGLRMAMAAGADLGNMGEAWWVPIVQIPDDTIEGKPRSRSVRLERTRPRSIIVNRAGKRFVNEACDYNSMAGAFHYLDPRGGYVNDPAWMVFDSLHLKHYGFLGIEPDGLPPEWFNQSADLTELGEKTGIDPDGLAATLNRWNDNVAKEVDPDFGRGGSAYDGYWGDDKATTTAGKTLGPIDTAPYFAVPISIGSMGTKGGPRTDADGRVLHVSGTPIAGLYAAGNAMAGVTGRAYGGAGGTIGPAMVFGFRAGYFAATDTSVKLPD